MVDETQRRHIEPYKAVPKPSEEHSIETGEDQEQRPKVELYKAIRKPKQDESDHTEQVRQEKAKDTYRAIPISETMVLKEDGTTDTLDNVIKENEIHEVYRARPHGSCESKEGETVMKTTEEKKAELLEMKAKLEYLRSYYEGNGEGSDHSTMGNTQTRQQTRSMTHDDEDKAMALYEGTSKEYTAQYSQSQYQRAMDAYEDSDDQEQDQARGEEQSNALVLRRRR